MDFQNVYGESAKGTADLRLNHVKYTSYYRRPKNVPVSKRYLMENLRTGTYRISIRSDMYRTVGGFVHIPEGETTREKYILPVHPDKVTDIEAPDYGDLPEALKKALRESILETYPDQKGKTLYLALDNIEKAGLLNLYCKMRHTFLNNNGNIFSYVTAFQKILGDRIYAKVPAALYHEVQKNISFGLFHEVSAGLHDPFPGYTLKKSFKTGEKYGNLQLTFSTKGASPRYSVDADIDDAGGIGHWFQVLGHSLTRKKTNPFDIHEILVHHQKLDPKYRLIV